MFQERKAIIDIGSNTIRLVIYGIDDWYNFEELQNVKVPSQLSQYLIEKDDKKYMSDTGIQRLITALDDFATIIKNFKVDEIKALATAAVRQSANQEEIIDRVKEKTGITIGIISEEEEARFGQYAVMHAITIPDALTIDIGGGSCEVTKYQDKAMDTFHSFPFGVVYIRERFFKNKDHNDEEAIEAARDYIRSQFKQEPWIKKAKLPLIGIGGSVRNVAEMHQRMHNYPIAGLHGYQMTLDDLEETLDMVLDTKPKDLDDIEGLSTERTDLIVPALIAFIELFKLSKAKNFTVSTQGLREGIILEDINKNYNTPIDTQLIRLRSTRKIAHDLPFNSAGTQQHVDLCLSLYQQMCDLDQFTFDDEEREMIEFATYLYRFASFVSREADSQHTFYLLSNTNLLGFSHLDRVRLALLSSYKNRSLFQLYMTNFKDWFSEEEEDHLMKVGGMIRFAQALNYSKTDPVKKLRLERDEDNNYLLKIYHTEPIITEKYRANRHKKHLSRALDGSLSLEFIPLDSLDE